MVAETASKNTPHINNNLRCDAGLGGPQSNIDNLIVRLLNLYLKVVFWYFFTYDE